MSEAGRPTGFAERRGQIGYRVMKPLLVFLLSLLPAVASAQQPRLVIIVGLGGDAEHAEVFHRWAAQLFDAAKDRYGLTPSAIVYLGEKPDRDPSRIGGRSSRETIDKTFATLATQAGADDPVFIVLIGHGSSDGREARFNLPGPDLSAADFAKLAGGLPSKHVVFVNTASASGGFVEALAGPGRTVVTATRNDAERYDTLFGGFFAEAFSSEDADVDKNRRVSVLEAFTYARLQVAQAYKREGLLQTEHALLDDNGDGKGTAEPTAQGADGQLAAALFLGVAGAGAAALPGDPALRALYEERQALERRVDALKLLKGGMEPARYAAELEKLLTELALKAREIREREKK